MDNSTRNSQRVESAFEYITGALGAILAAASVACLVMTETTTSEAVGVTLAAVMGIYFVARAVRFSRI